MQRLKRLNIMANDELEHAIDIEVDSIDDVDNRNVSIDLDEPEDYFND